MTIPLSENLGGAAASASVAVETAISLSEPRFLEQPPVKPGMTLGDILAAVGYGHPPLRGRLLAAPLVRLHVGSEFCDRLIPSSDDLHRIGAAAAAAGMAVTLCTPMVGDAAMATLPRLLDTLTKGTEVVVNDLGALRLVATAYPHLEPVAGRFLCKMIKDPRLPSEQWSRLYPHGIHAQPFVGILKRYGVRRLEMDVPPFATADDFLSTALRVTVHAPYGYAVKGRTCRPGSLHLDRQRKFAPGHGCRRECLDYLHPMVREGEASITDLHTFQRGNTVFYRHSAAMEAAVLDAVAQGRIARIVFAGDWNENHGPYQ